MTPAPVFVCMKRALLTAGVVALAMWFMDWAVNVEAGEIVKIRTNVAHGYAPLDVDIMMSVETSDKPGALLLQWDSPDGEGGSSKVADLYAGDSRQTFHVRRRFGIGTYTIQATVVRATDGKLSYHIAKTTLNVLEPGTPFVR